VWLVVHEQAALATALPAAGPDVTVISDLLDQLAADGTILSWAPGIYEPETHAFGGDAAIDAAHQLFHHDSRHLLTYDPPPAPGHLGRRETAVMLCSAMMRAAGLDLFEQADVWAKVAALRHALAPAPPDRPAALATRMRRLMTASTRPLCDPAGHGPLAGHDAWVAAFEQAGQTLACLARHGSLTRGLRAVLAHHVIFHANRAGLSLEDQRTLSALATEAVMNTGSPLAAAPSTTAEQLRDKLTSEIVSGGLVRTPAVEDAFRTVPRHLFVPEASLQAAYANSTVSIKQDTDGTTISCASQPGVVALMLEQLQPQPGHRVLEIGAGSGYNAALLARLTGPDGHVTTIDVDDDLVAGARSHLEAAAVTDVTVVLADGALGYAGGAPYDRIVATVGAHGIPQAWLDQVAPGGRLLVPQRLRGSVCRSIAYERQDGTWRSVSSEMNTFMPLRRGIADDQRRLIPVTSTGLVRLQTNSEQHADAGALADVLDKPRTVTWSGVLFAAMESAEWMELWLTCTLPSGLNQLPADKEATGTGLLTEPYRSSTAAFNQGALTYLTRRLSAECTAEGGKLWEFGVVAHGPGADDLTAEVINAMRTWDREHRSGQARFELHPLGADVAPGPSRFCVSTPLNQILIDWTS
jgi:protein-L-isoaspartate(D-aspartate) O-methyltransferase